MAHKGTPAKQTQISDLRSYNFPTTTTPYSRHIPSPPLQWSSSKRKVCIYVSCQLGDLLTHITGDTAEQPTTPSRRVVDDDLVTISFTLPRSVIDRNKIDVTVTPHSQRTAAADHREGTLDPDAPPRTPHRRVPHFELPGLAPNARAAASNVEVGEDPFISVQNDCGNPCVNDAAPNAVDPDDDEHDNPYLVYPLPAGRSIKELPLNATRPFGYFVVTKGKKIGVFYDVWYAFHYLLFIYL